MVPIKRLVGVYRANAGVRGEFRYLIDHYLRGESCSLCEITHSPFRRRAAWDKGVAALGVPLIVLHLNELGPGLADFVGDRAECVVAEADDDWVLLISRDELSALDGSVDTFFTLLRERLVDTENV